MEFDAQLLAAVNRMLDKLDPPKPGDNFDPLMYSERIAADLGIDYTTVMAAFEQEASRRGIPILRG